MSWLLYLQKSQPIAHGVIILCCVAALGLALGSVKVRGFSLGIAGTLFAGIFLGHLGLNMDPEVRGFIQEFGLILFVYTIGMQVGPGFVNSLRQQGLPLNLLAAGNVVLGAVIIVVLCYVFGLDFGLGAGIFAGATTNTPALGAAQEALRSLTNSPVASVTTNVLAGVVTLVTNTAQAVTHTPDRAALPALGYAVAYPFGVLGIILAMVILRLVFKMNVVQELDLFRKSQRAGHETLHRLTIVVSNKNLEGATVRSIPNIERSGVVISRIRHKGASEVKLATRDTVLHLGDVLMAVGKKSDLEKFRMIVGDESSEDLTQAPGQLTYRRVALTHKEFVGKSLRELALNHRWGVTVTRLTRQDLELSVSADLIFQFGDLLQIVGTEEDLNKAAEALGNSVKELNHAKLVPMFVGIALGVIAGVIPFHVSVMPAPLKLGLAGGPLIVAIILSRVGRMGPLLWYLPVNANMLLREFGIVLFLSCVGLRAGTHFVESLLQGGGFVWMGCGVAVTLVPLLVVGLVARAVMKMNFMNICGLLSGSMTDPPALAFANSYSNSDAPAVAYATVYPLTMVLRILLAQLIVILFCS